MNHFEPPTAPISPLAVDRLHKRALWAVAASVICFSLGGLLVLDFVRDVSLDLHRYRSMLMSQGPLRTFERVMLIQQLGTLLDGILGLAAGRLFWVGRRVTALILVLLSVLILALAAFAVAGLAPH